MHLVDIDDLLDRLILTNDHSPETHFQGGALRLIRPVLAGSNGTFRAVPILSAAFSLREAVSSLSPQFLRQPKCHFFRMLLNQQRDSFGAIYLFGLDGRTSTLLIKVLSGILNKVLTISAISSE